MASDQDCFNQLFWLIESDSGDEDGRLSLGDIIDELSYTERDERGEKRKAFV